MSAKTVHCAKLDQDLPALDPATPEGRSALKMALLLGGPEVRDRIQASISLDAWRLWKDHMRMVINEFRLDATSDKSNAILCEYMVAFLFGEGRQVPGYVPPAK